MGKVENVVFLSLVLDLFGECLHRQPCHSGVRRECVAFTIPLPLFPRIIEWYTQVCVHPRQFPRPACALNQYLEGIIGSTWFFIPDIMGGVHNSWVVLQPI